MNKQKNTLVKRTLKPRHMQMIAIGGCIGSGLFMASGETIAIAGAPGALIAYIIVGIMIYFLMSFLGEMATYMPVSGSWSTYASRFIDPSLGFALGWSYWLSWVLTAAIDISVASMMIYYWDFTHILPIWTWGLLLFIFILFTNSLSAKIFGESEFWICLIKVVTIIIFIILGFLQVFGLIGNHHYIGFTNFNIDTQFFTIKNMVTIIGVFIISAFSFQGTELVGIAAGESENPKRDIPKAINKVFWRILIFYIFTMLIIGLIIPQNSPYLLGGSTNEIAKSPFTLVFENSGIKMAANIINTVIILSLLSAANSGIYSSTRMLYALAKEKQANKIFTRTSESGVPIFSLLLTIVISLLVIILNMIYPKYLSFLFTSVGVIGMFAWLGITLSYINFRRGFIIQNKDLNSLVFKAKFYPVAAILTIFLCLIIILGLDTNLILEQKFDLKSFTLSYYGVLFLILFYLYHKIKYKTKFINPKDIDFSKK